VLAAPLFLIERVGIHAPRPVHPGLAAKRPV